MTRPGFERVIADEMAHLLAAEMPDVATEGIATARDVALARLAAAGAELGRAMDELVRSMRRGARLA